MEVQNSSQEWLWRLHLIDGLKASDSGYWKPERTSWAWPNQWKHFDAFYIKSWHLIWWLLRGNCSTEEPQNPQMGLKINSDTNAAMQDKNFAGERAEPGNLSGPPAFTWWQ